MSLIGNPQAVALPATRQLLFEYEQWLAWEHVALQQERLYGWSAHGDYLEGHAAFHVAQYLHGPGPDGKHFKGANAGLRSFSYHWHHGRDASLDASGARHVDGRLRLARGVSAMSLVEVATMAVKVWRVRRLLAKAKRHQDASTRLGAKAARIMPEIAR